MNTTDLMQLMSLHEEAMKSYREGVRDPSRIVSPAGMETLVGFGISPVFLYDCVDDLSRYGEPGGCVCRAGGVANPAIPRRIRRQA